MTDAARRELEEALRHCASEPIHQPGAIQPHGVLLGIDQSLLIRHASENLEIYFGCEARAVVGAHLDRLFGDESIARLQEALRDFQQRPMRNLALSIERSGETVVFDVQLHASGTLVLVELEPRDPKESPAEVFDRVFVPIRDALWKLDAETDLVAYTQQVVDHVRLLTGFDRVMMYRFADNWDGEVIAESRVGHAESYLGHRFPASDIPSQARALYTHNLLRLIVDVEAAPSPLYPRLDEQGRPLDLSLSVLRSFSPVHLEYLRNMQVQASLSISLLQNRRLWGLIACHHSTPRHVPYQIRELAEFAAKSVSIKLSDFEAGQRSDYHERIQGLLTRVTVHIRGSGDVESTLRLYGQDLLDLVGATGAVLSINRRKFHVGATPDVAVLESVLDWARTMAPAEVLFTDCLGREVPELASAHRYVSGVLIAPVDPNLSDYVVWFRPERVQTVKWAGDPDKPVLEATETFKVSPRTSFAAWVKTYRGQSAPWLRHEIDAANALALAVVEVFAQRAIRESETNFRLLAQYSGDLVARLDVDGTYLFTSTTSADLLGYSPPEMIGKSVFDFLFVDDEQELRDALQRVAERAVTQFVALRHSRKDGRFVWLEAHLKPFRSADGTVAAGFVLTGRDVTDRRSYHEALEELHRRHHLVLDAVGEGILAFDTGGPIDYANAAAATLLGWSDEQLHGMDFCAAICAQRADYAPEQAGVCPNEQPCGQGVPSAAHDVRLLMLKRADGSTLAAHCFWVTLAAAADRRRHLLVFREHGHPQAAGRLDEGVLVTDPQGRIVAVSDGFSRITGYAEREVLGRTPAMLKSGVHTPDFYRNFWRQLNTSRFWRGELWNRRSNGEIYPQWTSIHGIVDDSGTLLNYVAAFADISRAKKVEEQLHHLANHDALTGLPNQQLLNDHLKAAIERAHQTGRKIAVALIDLDRFKMINDTMGHVSGDRFLYHVATRLSQAAWQQDFIARWGGDEFLVVIEGVDDARAALARVRRYCAALEAPVRLTGRDILPEASVGVSVFPDDAAEASGLLQAAGTATHRAKEAGRNRVEFYTSQMTEAAQRRFELAVELRQALRNDELLLHYQPQVAAADGTLVGFESLVRWLHPRKGMIPPGEFIPLAEELGLITEIGTWALRAACAQVQRWRAHSGFDYQVAVNAAPGQLVPGFAGILKRALEEFDVPPALIEVEITESALQATPETIALLQEIKGLGVKLAIDDFGTGYSSLSHLKHFPVDRFKIDKSFIDGLPHAKHDVAIVRTVVALGKSLDINVLAEGVENGEQAAFLREEGVDAIQGYVFGRPLSPEDVEKFITTSARKPKRD